MDLAGQALAFVGCYEAADFIECECCVEAKAEFVELTPEQVEVTRLTRSGSTADEDAESSGADPKRNYEPDRRVVFRVIRLDHGGRRLQALRQSGIVWVDEIRGADPPVTQGNESSAVGAYQVARKTAQYIESQPDHSHICTACPAVVRYVERYQPELVDRLVPVVSPMLAHARHLKEKLGLETKVIFIGPCVAKKAEAEDPQNEGFVDCVITFTELVEWFKRENVSMTALEESSFDESPEGNARFFPLVGGSVRTADLTTDVLAKEVISVSGFNEVHEALAGIATTSRVVIEPLFCSQGCINGPAVPIEKNIYERRKDILTYATNNRGHPPKVTLTTPTSSLDLHRSRSRIPSPRMIFATYSKKLVNLNPKINSTAGPADTPPVVKKRSPCSAGWPRSKCASRS
jgi:hypothetical protein